MSEKEVCRNKETGPYYWAGIALRRSFFLESNLKPFAVTMKMYHIYIFFFKKKRLYLFCLLAINSLASIMGNA